MAQRAPIRDLRSGTPNRIPPHNLDAEQSVLGAMLESKDAISNVLGIIEPEDFYKPAHTEIFEAILALYNRSENADAITIAEELSRRGSLDQIGGKPYIHGLLEAYPTASSATRYARIVEEHSRLRRLVSAGTEIQEIGFSMPEDVDGAVDTAEEIIYNVADRRLTDTMQPIRDLLTRNMEQIEKLYERGEAVTGIPTGFHDLDEITSGFQGSNFIIVAARPGMGKCLVGSSLIDDPSTGERVTIERFVAEKRPRVVGVAADGSLTPLEVADWIPNGTKPCFRLTTRLGRTIEATANHPLLTVDGWTPLENLEVGRKIAVPRHLPTNGPGADLSDARIRLLAYFIAEGGLTGGTARFTNTDPEIIEDFTAAFTSEFPDCDLRVDRLTLCARNRIRSNQPNAAVTWLREIGLMGKGAADKRFPDFVWRFSQPQMSDFLKALFSCDGTVYWMSGYPRIEFTVASEGLAEDVQHALLRYGVIAKLWRKTERSWRVEITEPASVQIYQTSIGWTGEKARRVLNDPPALRHTNNGHLPMEVWDLVKKVAAQAGLSLAELSRRAGESMSNIHTNRGLPQLRLARYAEILDNDDLRWLANPDLYWDEVVAIEPIGEREVFDITVPRGHNFVAEDIVVHNSAILNDFALSCALKERAPVLMFNLEMSRDELTKRFLASEAKVDSQRISKGTLQEQDWTRLSSALGRLAEAPIFIDDSANVTLMEIRAKCRRLKAKHGLGLVIIDYLQLMQSPRKSENRQQEVSEISRNLKILARELEVPVICAAQLNRAVEYRADKRPLLGDLRESGCLTADTKILRADSGRSVTMGELFKSGERNIPVWTLDEDLKMVRGTMTHVFSSGVKKVYRMRLRSGREVKASANHPFLTFDGWRALEDLQIGEKLAVPRVVPKPTQTIEWPDEKIALLAHLIGDGCFVERQPLHYTNMDEANCRTVAEAARYFGVTARWVRQKNWWHIYLPSPFPVTHGRHNPIVAWLKELGIHGLRSREKFIPDEVFELSNAHIALFLRHLWATDGHIGIRKNGAVSVHYSSGSRRLIEDVRMLLLRLGVRTTVSTLPKDGYSDCYSLLIQGGEAQSIFLAFVGANGSKDEAALDALGYLSTRSTNTNIDTIPRLVWDKVKLAMKREGITSREFAAQLGTAYCGSTLYRHSPSRPRLARAADLLDDSDLRVLAESDVFWDEIREIEYLGEEEVFDATVPGTHNFIANGIVAHNSLEQDTDIVMFLYRDEVYNPDTEHRGEAELIIAKHRNGPTATIRLAFMNQFTKFASMARVPGGH